MEPNEQGTGRVTQTAHGERWLTVGDTAGEPGYVNAQLDDYGARARHDFAWRPPVTLRLEARFHFGIDKGEGGRESHGAAGWDGTAGFGFWNAPFGDGGNRRVPVLPTAIWFFLGGASSNMAFARGVPGRGWKAATIHGHDPWGYGLMPLAPLGALLFRSKVIYRRLWPWLERRLGIGETALPDALLQEWHTYAVEWGVDEIVFRVDNEIVHVNCATIEGPLGLVIWIDNQYMVATPQGLLRWGMRPVVGTHSLAVRNVKVARNDSHSHW